MSNRKQIGFHADYRPISNRWEILDHLRHLYYEVDRCITVLPVEIVNVHTGDVRRDAYQLLKSIEIMRGKMIQNSFDQGVSPIMDADALQPTATGLPQATSTPLSKEGGPSPTFGRLPVEFDIGGVTLRANNQSTISRFENDQDSSYQFSPLNSQQSTQPSWGVLKRCNAMSQRESEQLTDLIQEVTRSSAQSNLAQTQHSQLSLTTSDQPFTINITGNMPKQNQNDSAQFSASKPFG